jgi:hypothetical protein
MLRLDDLPRLLDEIRAIVSGSPAYPAIQLIRSGNPAR